MKESFVVLLYMASIKKVTINFCSWLAQSNMMEYEIQLSMNKPAVLWVFFLQHVSIGLFFPPFAFPWIHLVDMDFKTEDWAVNVTVHPINIPGNVCNRTRALYCISDNNYLVLRNKFLVNVLAYLVHLKLISGAFLRALWRMWSVWRIFLYVKVGKITVSRELKAMLGTLRAGWNRK